MTDPDHTSRAQTRTGVAPIKGYVAVVSVLGLGGLVTLVLSEGLHLPGHDQATFWLLIQFVLISELIPIIVPRRNAVEEVTTSTTFAFALMLGWGTAPAVYVLALATALSDLSHRKGALKVFFNVGQYALSMELAGGLYRLLGGGGSLTPQDLGPMVAAAATFVILNHGLTAIAIGLSQVLPIRQILRRDMGFNGAVAATLLAMSPIVIVVSQRMPLLVPLLTLPVAAVHLAAKSSVENIQLVARLEESLAQATELNRMKDEFVAMVSHELRTPLTSIQGYVKTVLQVPLEDQDRQVFLEGAERQTERLTVLIEQLLLVSRLDYGAEPGDWAHVSVETLVAGPVEEIRAHANSHAWHLDLHEGLPDVRTDSEKVRQILNNLIENALKYSPPESSVWIQARADDGGVIVSVEDEGFGIPLESWDRIFDRFYQVDQSLTRKVGGVGLGLYICRKLAEGIGADLWLEASGPEGSVFSLRLPVEATKSARSAAPDMVNPLLGSTAPRR